MRKARSLSLIHNCISCEFKKKSSLSAGFYLVTLALCCGDVLGRGQHKLDLTEHEGYTWGKDLHTCGI